jgi:hypothetical protein
MFEQSTDACGPSIECLPERSVVAGLPAASVLGVRSSTELFAEVGPAVTLEPLVPKFRKPFCLGSRGDKVLIQGHVLQQIVNVQSAPFPRPDFSEDLIGSALPVKLRVRRCKFPGWVYIDADQHVLMDGGEDLEVQIVAPQSWLTLPNPDVPAGGDLPADYVVVDVKVRACVLHCCPPRRSTLTLYSNNQQQATAMARPRRATELWIASGVAAPGNSSWHWEDLSGTFVGGFFFVNGAVVNQPAFPGAGEVLVMDSAATSTFLVWRIE